jgi:hypothetical protein
VSTCAPSTFEDRLLEALLAFRASPPRRVGVRRTPVHVHTARRRWATALVGAAAIVVMMALVTVGVGGPSARRTGPGLRATEPTRIHGGGSSAPLRARMVDAVTSAQDLVMHSTVVTTNGVRIDLWKDPVGHALTTTMRDAQGALLMEMASRPTADRGFESMIVDGRNETWFRQVVAPGSAVARFMQGFSWANQLYDADTLRSSLAEIASFAVVGTEVVDGVDATHVHVVAHDGGTLDLWIDPATSLPLKSVTPGADSASSRGVAHYRWYAEGAVVVPWPTPPAGYTERDPVPLRLVP